VKDRDQVPKDEVLKLIDAEPDVWLRLAILREGDEWWPILFDMVGGAPPPRWQEDHWDYEDVRLASIKVPGDTVRQWVVDARATLDDVEVQLPSVHESLSVERRQSKHYGTYETLEWPVMEYTLNWSDLKRGSGVGPLIGDVSPSFFQFQAAAASFFGVELAGRNIDNGPWMFRRQDVTGRLKRVQLTAAGTNVTVTGTAITGMTLELASDVPGPSRAIPASSSSREDGSTEVTVEFAGGLHRNAWVLLREGRRWVDRRFLNWGYRTTADEGIEVEVERREQLEAIVASGEGPTVEFKVELPPAKATPEQLHFLRTVAAFANVDGGTILFGVRDDGEVVGLLKSDTDGRTKDRVTNLVRGNMAPLPDFSVELYDVDDKPDKMVLVLHVEAGPAPPYGVKPGNPSYYLRRGATTFPASADQLRALARSRPPMARDIAFPWA